MKTIYMGTTSISVDKTIGELQQYLIDAGAQGIMTEIRNKRIEALTFQLLINGHPVPFMLPVRTEQMFLALQRERSPRTRERMEEQDRQQADRIAWRQILRWVQAQLALIETGMVQPAEVFLPYIRLATGETWYQSIAAKQFKALPHLKPEA